ncbi:MAG: nucleotidyltransferase domain-containing protein [Planctomycetes bacterium]|nr:nucleotidyltransferase domain-containing protein [Planctomycetota bacterium]
MGLPAKHDEAREGAAACAAAPKDRHGSTIDVDPIRPLLERILVVWRPAQIWLFGSRARGDALPGSDWDLLVVVPDETAEANFDPVIGWQMQKECGVRADVVPCRARDFREDRSTHNTLAFEAVMQGVLLYER